jgi:anti-sigma regulatory factor (Ser/Thr protein kinase)
MTATYRLTHAAELETLAKFRAFISAICKEHGIDEDAAHDLQLAIDEACTNVIQHGYAEMDPGSLILEVMIDPAQTVVHITDFGHPFEPSDHPQPDINAPLEDRPLGGFGLFFIYSTMDSVDYQTSEAGNVLILKKKRQTASS